jgi:hypothetical protein
MLLHSSFPTGKIPWKEVSVWNLSEKVPTEILVPRRILAEKLAGRSIVAEQFVSYSQEKMFSEKRQDNFSERIPGNKILGKDPLHENSNSLLPRRLGFQADMRLKEIGLETVRCRAVSATIFLCMPAFWLQEISNFKF